MNCRNVTMLLGLAASLGCSVVGSSCRADAITIDPGFDLLAGTPYQTTLPYGNGAQVTSVPVPLTSYDFGNGPIAVGNTSWIDERLSTIVLATIGDSATTPVDFLVRQGISAQAFPYDELIPGATGSGYVWLALDLNSPANGSMTITRTSDTGGTFTESLTARYSYYENGPTGALIGSSPFLTNTITGTWQTTPPPGGVVIAGVNNDNFFIPQATGSGPYSPVIPLYSASVPEPPSAVLSMIGIVLLAGYYRHRRRALVAGRRVALSAAGL